MAGRGSLAGLMPYGDANAIVMDMAREVLPVVREVPVLAGVCGTDPFRSMQRFLAEVSRAGFRGVQNFPTVGLIDGTFRVGLEETGMGYALEVEMVPPRIAETHGVVGFVGASSMERLPTEVAITENMKRFKAIAIEEGS
jgi:predicted TIM-barrel enzyme